MIWPEPALKNEANTLTSVFLLNGNTLPSASYTGCLRYVQPAKGRMMHDWWSLGVLESCGVDVLSHRFWGPWKQTNGLLLLGDERNNRHPASKSADSSIEAAAVGQVVVEGTSRRQASRQTVIARCSEMAAVVKSTPFAPAGQGLSQVSLHMWRVCCLLL